MSDVDAVITVRLRSGGEVRLELTGGGFNEAEEVLFMFCNSLSKLGALTTAIEPVPTEPVGKALPSAPAHKPAKAKPTAKTNGTGKLTCDVAGCGKQVNGAQGLQVHKARVHKPSGNGNGATPPVGDGDLRLRCNDCDYTTDTHSFAKLRTHTTMAHQRAPHQGIEDRPRTASALDLALD